MPELNWQPQPGELEFDAIRASGPGGQNVKRFSYYQPMTVSNGNAYSYVRFSSAKQRHGHSQRRQTEAIQAYCIQHGLRLATEPDYSFLDAARSAWKGEHLGEHGQLARFFRLVQDGTIERGSTLIVESLDRLSRADVRSALAQFLLIIDAGIRIVTLTDGRVYDEGCSDQDLVISIFVMSRAHEESSTKAKRLADRFADKRASATTERKPMGDVGPYWLRLKDDKSGFEPIPEKVAAVRRIFELCVQGYGKNAIAKMLNAEGVPTLSGKEAVKGWGTSAIHHVINSRAVLGEWQPMTRTQDPRRKKRVEAGDAIPDYFPAVIDEELFYRAQEAVKTRRTTKATKQTKDFNVWQGVAKCLHCGSPMHIVNKGQPPRGFTYLDCSLGRKGLCPSHRLIRLDYSEKVFRLMLARLDMQALVKDSAAKLSKALAATVGELAIEETKLADMKRFFQASPSQSAADTLAETERRIAALEARRIDSVGELAAEDAISFDTFMGRLSLESREDRSLANSLLKRHSVLVFVSSLGFVVTEDGMPRFGVGYDKAKREAGYFDLSMWRRHTPPEEEPHQPAHRAAMDAMPRIPVLYFTPPEEAGPGAYAIEADRDQAIYDAQEDEGQPLSEVEFLALRHLVKD